MADDDLTAALRGALEREPPTIAATLQQIISDPTTPAATRVSAARTLHGIRGNEDAGPQRPNALAAHFDEISDEALDREIDIFMAPEIAGFCGEPTRWPRLTAAVEAEVERRVAKRLRSMRAVRKLEREREKVDGEIERRAEELAREKYARREFTLIEADEQPAKALDGPTADEPPPAPKQPVEPPDVSLGWPGSPARRDRPRFL